MQRKRAGVGKVAVRCFVQTGDICVWRRSGYPSSLTRAASVQAGAPKTKFLSVVISLGSGC